MVISTEKRSYKFSVTVWKLEVLPVFSLLIKIEFSENIFRTEDSVAAAVNYFNLHYVWILTYTLKENFDFSADQSKNEWNFRLLAEGLCIR